MGIPHSTVGRRDGEQWRWAPIATLTPSSLVQTGAHVINKTIFENQKKMKGTQ